MDNMQLAQRLRAFRKLKGYTQQQLAEETGLSLTVLGSLERGNRKVEDHMVEAIARTLGVSVQEIKGIDR
ncbi:helix-turn-helix transcriptional regulator [Paenibacillus sp. JX-17]|uniref:Helix-turn-helix transcriptional regulator n=1 Tax=Paenibacillus lacisoli TaxID=3064525 RepID=A0ABT9CH39_9BACL|nr:helix-turn-helix transcriptional regulator [Paenibacillus sp. JX-17]MDO7908599.1 helix-turn-helix transcriptional regulator [Paenibacillus sp. JX-17]